MARPSTLTVCGVEYNAPLRPGDKVSHMWLCELRRGHAGQHLSPSHSISATMASRGFTLRAVIAALPPITDEEVNQP